MSSTQANGEINIQILRKAKMSGETATLHLDGIPPDVLSKVCVTWMDESMLNYAELSVLLNKTWKLPKFIGNSSVSDTRGKVRG